MSQPSDFSVLIINSSWHMTNQHRATFRALIVIVANGRRKITSSFALWMSTKMAQRYCHFLVRPDRLEKFG